MTKAMGAKRSGSKAELMKRVAENLSTLSVADVRAFSQYIEKIAAHRETPIFSAYLPEASALRGMVEVTFKKADGEVFVAYIRAEAGKLAVLEPTGPVLAKHGSTRRPVAGASSKPQSALGLARANFDSFRRGVVSQSLSLTQAAKRMDLTTEGLSGRVDRGEMVAFRDGNRKMVPVDLLDDKQPTRTVQGLPDVIRAAAAARIEPFRLAAWLITPSRALGERRPVDELRLGNVGKVVRAVTNLGVT